MSGQDSGLRFDGKVVIVTGAGNMPSMGHSHARLFAERGASVVVNDLGLGIDGRGRVRADAAAVARDIREAGGVAVADTNSVADADSAEAVVQTALDEFGRVDVLVNNAGAVNHALLDEVSRNDIRRMVEVNLLGTIWMTRAAWPHMKGQGYGRIVNIASGAMLGVSSHVAVYGASKGGVWALARNLAVEGGPLGIKVNTVLPASGGVSVGLFVDPESEWGKMMNERNRPELVTPAVALLGHEDCPCTGKVLDVAGGRVREVFIGATQGYNNPELSLDDLAAHWDQVVDRSDPTWYPDAIEYEVPPYVTRPYEPS